MPKRTVGLVACLLLGQLAIAATATGVPPLQRGQSVVLLGTDPGTWGPLWGEPINGQIFTRPLLRPSDQANAYLALQPVHKACARSPASDHERVYEQRQFFANALALGDGIYTFDPSISVILARAQPRAAAVRSCLWFARSPRERIPAATQITPFLNGTFAATITSLVSPPGEYQMSSWYAEFPTPRYRPIHVSGSCGSDTFDDVLNGGGTDYPDLGTGGCSTSLTFGGQGTLAYSPALAAQRPPPVAHLGNGCEVGEAQGMSTAEAVYYLDQQGCTVDRLIGGPQGQVEIDGGLARQSYPTAPGQGGGNGSEVVPVGTHVDLDVPGISSIGGRRPPKVHGQATQPAPPGSQCEDIATLSPSFAGKEKKLIELPSLSSEDMPISLTAGVSLGSVGVCSRALQGALTPSVDERGLGIEFHYAHGKHEQTRSAGYSFLPFDWRLPSDTGGSAPGAAEIEWDGEVARGIEVRPSLSFGYSRGKKPEVTLDLISVPVAKETATLLSGGRPFLNATVGPELTLGLKVDRRELERIEAEALASGLSAAAAIQYVAQELRDEVAAAADEELPSVDPQPIDVEGVAPEMGQVEAQVGADMAAQETIAEQDAEAFQAEEIDNVIELPFRAVEGVEGDVVDVVEADPEVLAALAAAGDRTSPVAGITRVRRPRVPTMPLSKSRGRVVTVHAAKLTVLHHLRLRALRRAPLPRADVAHAVHSVLTAAVRVRVGALGVSSTRLRPGARLTLVAVGLGSGPPHAAQLVLAGPGYRATRLLEVRTGGGAATLVLPRRLASGRWTLAIEDLSPLTAGKHGITGAAIARMGIFTVRRRRP